jgi:hypothetical protein
VEQLRRVHSLLAATLRVSPIIEVATGCALLTVPSGVIQALIGSRSDQAEWIVGRVLGVRWSPSASPRCSHPARRPSVGWR